VGVATTATATNGAIGRKGAGGTAPLITTVLKHLGGPESNWSQVSSDFGRAIRILLWKRFNSLSSFCSRSGI
jgi:hypothetical protein